MRKTIVSIAIGIVLISVALYQFYTVVESDKWDEQADAISRAYAGTELVKIDKVQPFNGERPYTILFGEDADGAELIVWVGEAVGDGAEDADRTEDTDGSGSSDGTDDSEKGAEGANESLGEIHSEYAADGVSKPELEQQLHARDASIQILRMLPGKWNDEYVWEVFYRKPDEGGGVRHYYDYYRFADGELLDTYRLNKR